jgi:hypothetical protein
MNDRQRRNGEKLTSKVKVPPNIYNRGLLCNLSEVLLPLSSRPADGFVEAQAVPLPERASCGVMRSFPRVESTATSHGNARGDDTGEEEYDSEDSDDGATLPGAQVKVHAD